MALVGIESAASATYGLEEFHTASGTIAVASSPVKYGNRALNLSPSAWCTVRPEQMALADAGRRVTRWFRMSALPGALSGIMVAAENTPAGIIGIGVSTGGVLQLLNGNFSVIKSGTTLSVDTWYRIALCYTITSTTNWSAKIYLDTVDGHTQTSPDMSATNADATLTRTGSDRLYTEQGAGGSGQFYFSPVVADDDTSLNDPGDLRAVPALPDAESTNNFDTAIGNARGASDFNNVNERPLSESNGWRQAAITQVAESFILEQTLTALDVDLTGKTILGHMAWCWSKKGSDPFVPCTHRSAVSGSGNWTTGGTMTIPAGVATGDMLVVGVTSQGSTSGSANVTCTDNDSGGNTWTTIYNSADKKAWLFAKRATSATASKTITIANGVTKTAGGCEVFKDAATSLSVANTVINITPETNSSGDETHATMTPSVGGCAIGFSIHDYSAANDASAQSTASLGSMTERVSHLPGGAGADAALSISTIDGTNAAAAATGSITWAQTNGTTYSVVFAVRPELTWAAPAAKLIRNGTDVAITLTTSPKLFTDIATDGTYPASPFGMKSTGNYEDTDLYECGGLIVYLNAGANTLTAAQGSFALTGQAATPKANRLLTAAQASFTETGNAAGLNRQFSLSAAQGSFSLSGQASTLKASRVIAAAQASLTLTGQSSTFQLTRLVLAVQASFTLTGNATALAHSATLTAAQGSFTFTGQASTLQLTRRVSAAHGTFVLSGQDADLSVETGPTYTLTADAGSFTLTGNAAGLNRTVLLSASHGAFTHSGQAASLIASRKLTAAQAAFTLNGQAAALSLTLRMAAAQGSFTLAGQTIGLLHAGLLTAAQSTFTLTGVNAGFVSSHGLTAAQASFTLTGFAATLTYTPIGQYALSADTGIFSLSGQSATFVASHRVDFASGSFALTGQSANLVKSASLVASSAAFTLTGQAAALAGSHRLTSSPGTFMLTGQSAELTRIRELVAAPGIFVLSGQAISFTNVRILEAAFGSFALTGFAASLTRQVPEIFLEVILRERFAYSLALARPSVLGACEIEAELAYSVARQAEITTSIELEERFL